MIIERKLARQISFDYSGAMDFVAAWELDNLQPLVSQAHSLLHGQAGPGKEYTGWLDWPISYNREELKRVKDLAAKIRERAEVLVVIGIGGSYIGARSALELLGHSFYNQLPKEKRGGPEIYFAGHNMSSSYLVHLLELVKDKEIVVNVVSKSGTTLEPAIAFRIFRQLLEERYGKEGAAKRIVATTDKDKGALKKLAGEEGYETFIVPDDVGGRYSVLTPVGLLPIAASGVDVDEIMAGAMK
ncbi:MAG: glucose-6-phosphate isomerase, partial [Clostridia bacterium]|nr:glucose-6-phosphate isomerase [Clostridia bacterium]